MPPIPRLESHILLHGRHTRPNNHFFMVLSRVELCCWHKGGGGGGGGVLDLDSLVVTHPTTNSPACGLSTAERTGSPVFHTLWSYVLGVTLGRLIKRKSPLLKWVLYEAKWRAGVAPDIPPIHTGLLVYGADDVDGGVQKIHLDIWHSTRQHRAHIRKVCGRVIGHAAGRTWHGVDGQALNYIADHAQIGTLLGGAACVFTTLGIIYAVRRYHSIIAIK
ncbi:hypothetical protein N7445_007820 [Penicillium cf. griseofulvum]|nr:hypothetical protein N7445_007820 [Penicillium cf. griseofulvum]